MTLKQFDNLIALADARNKEHDAIDETSAMKATADCSTDQLLALAMSALRLAITESNWLFAQESFARLRGVRERMMGNKKEIHAET